MSKCKTYEELADLVKSVNVDHHFELSENVHHAKMKFEVDTTAQQFYPSDGPQELTPCKCHGDGNCFPRCVSKLLFGTEDHHLAIHATLVYEAIIHKNFYLDNTYLKYGAVGDNNFKSQFAIYSEAFKKVKPTNCNDHTLL